jgi:hypothetical protein
MPSKAVFGIVPSQDLAEIVVSELSGAGFATNDISVLLPDKAGTRDFAHEKNTKAPEGAAAGAATGGIAGGTLGLLAGLGALAIPGFGPLIAAGPLLAALSGAAVGAGVGGLTGALVGMGIPELEAKQYEGKIRDGNVLISVHAEDGKEVDRVKDIFKRLNVSDVGSTGESAVPKARPSSPRPSRPSSPGAPVNRRM